MSLWLVRAGSQGEYEDKFLSEGRIYLTWDGQKDDLGKLSDRNALNALLVKNYSGERVGVYSIWTGQLWNFAKEIDPKDWIVLPS